MYAIKPLVVPEIHPWTNKRRMQSDQFRQPPHDPEAAQRRSQQENILLAQILEGGIQDLGFDHQAAQARSDMVGETSYVPAAGGGTKKKIRPFHEKDWDPATATQGLHDHIENVVHRQQYDPEPLVVDQQDIIKKASGLGATSWNYMPTFFGAGGQTQPTQSTQGPAMNAQ